MTQTPLKFEDVFGDPKMVDSSADLAIGELIADSIGAGTGMPRDWDRDFEISEEKRQDALSYLHDVIDAAFAFMHRLCLNDDEKRACWRHMLEHVMRQGPNWSSRGLVVFDLHGGELQEEVLDRMFGGMPEAEAAAMRANLDKLVFAGGNAQIEVEPTQTSRNFATVAIKTVLQLLAAHMPTEPEIEGKLVGLDGKVLKGQ